MKKYISRTKFVNLIRSAAALKVFLTSNSKFEQKMESVRDMSIPYTEEEVAKILSKFRTLSSYDPERDTFSAVQEGLEAFKVLGYERSEGQRQAYVDYYVKNLEGRCHVASLEPIVRVLHSPALEAALYAKMCDTNGDGIISKEEFEGIYELMCIQYPKMAGKTFEDFQREADADRSGDVDVKEMTAWLESLQRKET